MLKGLKNSNKTPLFSFEALFDGSICLKPKTQSFDQSMFYFVPLFAFMPALPYLYFHILSLFFHSAYNSGFCAI